MSFGTFLKDRCTIYRYTDKTIDDITKHEKQEVGGNIRCHLIQKSTRSIDEKGRTKIISTYTLLLSRKTDIQAGDLVQVNGETLNDEPVLYEAQKPARPGRHHIRVILNEEVER